MAQNISFKGAIAALGDFSSILICYAWKGSCEWLSEQEL